MAKELIQFKNSFNDTLLGLAWENAKAKANIVIFTGMQETAERYDGFASFLNKYGFSVFCLDHYGQGLNIKENDAKGIWPKSGFSKSVKTFGEFIDKLKKSNVPTYIFAHSMGSFMAQDFIQRFPDKVNKAVICGSDYAKPGLMKFAYTLSKILVTKKKRDLPNKTLANLVTGAFAKAVKNAKTDFDWLSYNEENVQKYIKDPKCGFVATGGFYSEFLKGMKRISKKKFLKKINPSVKLLIIAGEEDPVGHMGKGPKKLFEQYSKLGIKDVKLKLYKNMRHEILNETNKDIVYKEVLEFFNH